jgi:hypothetical protein
VELAPLAVEGLVLLREPCDELVRVGAPGGIFHLGIGGVVAAVRDVVPHRSNEQEDVLRHDGQPTAIRAQAPSQP